MMRPTTLTLLLLSGMLARVAMAQAVAEEALPQNAADEAAPAVESQTLDEQPPLPSIIGRRGGPAATVQRGKPIPPWVRPPDDKPPVPSPQPPPPGGGGPPDFPDFEDEQCISDPDVFAKAFVTGTVKCVSDDLIVRVERDIEGNISMPRHTKQFMVETFIKARVKTVTFWSYGDNAEKYLRIGRKDMTLGNFVDNPPPIGLQTGSFPGIQDSRNFAALLEAIGYSSTDTDPKRPHFLVVTTRPNVTRKDPRAPPVALYKPTWANVVKYMQHYISSIAANDREALERAGIDPATADKYRMFKFDGRTTEILQTSTFADLSGCKAQCTVQDTLYGTPGISGPNTWTTPTRSVNRVSEQACNLTQFLPPSRYELTEPTIIEENDNFCDNSTARPYLYYYKTWKNFWTVFGTDRTANRALALMMAKAYMDETTDLRKTIAFRTFLQQGSAGSFNALFSGDGYTYTGNGGFVGATGTEVHTGEVPSIQDVPLVYPKVRLVFFCIVSVDGNPYLNNICPSGVDDSFATNGIAAVKQLVGKPNWDIEEVN